MLYADDAGLASKSTQGRSTTMTFIANVFGVAGLTASETTTVIMPPRTRLTSPLVIEEAGQRLTQANKIHT